VTPLRFAEPPRGTRGPAARRAIEHVGRQATADALGEALTDSRQPNHSYLQDNAFRYVVATA
jgi:hypothetical protein